MKKWWKMTCTYKMFFTLVANDVSTTNFMQMQKKTTVIVVGTRVAIAWNFLWFYTTISSSYT